MPGAVFTAGAVALAATAAALLLQRRLPWQARWAAWCTTLAFVVVAARGDVVHFVERAVARAVVPFGGDAEAVHAQLVAAAAVAGPRAIDVELRWAAPLTFDAPRAAFGAEVVLPKLLPFGPDDVTVTLLGAAVASRPLLLQVEGPRLAPTDVPRTLSAQCTVRAGDVVLADATIPFGAGPAAVECTPPAAGRCDVELTIACDGALVRVHGGFDVGPAPSVLVLDPSGVAAAALRAQGVAVAEAEALPADWRTHAAVVLGRPLPVPQQEDLVAGLLDGHGVFVLGPAFGGAGEPVHAMLPVRPLPPPEPGRDGPPVPGGAGAEQPPRPDEAPPDPPRPSDDPPRPDANAPVSAEPIEVDKHSVAMVLVIDRSGSMGNTLPNGATKMSYAKTSALRTAQALGEGDVVGVVTFGDKDRGRIELPLTAATDAVRVHAGINRLAHASERTFLLSGLRVAHDLLRDRREAVKHVVVVTDGEFDVRESIALRAEAHRMRSASKVTVSVISLVDAFTDPQFRREAEMITRDGGGHFLPLDDATAVPALVSAEVTRALSRVGREPRRPGVDARTEGPVSPPPEAPPPVTAAPATAPTPTQRLVVRAVVDSPLLLPVPAAWPTLGAAVAGEARLDARVLLVAGEDGWPLLAYGNRGLGRIGVFAADLGGEAGGEFRGAAPLPAWLAQWVQSVLPALPREAGLDVRERASVAPPAPTPRDAAVATAIAGAPPVAATGDLPPAIARERGDDTAAAARWLVLALLLFALVERVSAARALQCAAG